MGVSNWIFLALVGLVGGTQVFAGAACSTQLTNLAVSLSPNGQYSVAVTQDGRFVQLSDTATRQGRAWNPLARLNPLLTPAADKPITSLSVLDLSQARYIGSALLAYTDSTGHIYLGSTYSSQVQSIARPSEEEVQRVVFARDPSRLYAFTPTAVFVAVVRGDRKIGPWRKEHSFSSAWLEQDGLVDFHLLSDDGTQVLANERGKILILHSDHPPRELQYPVWMMALSAFSSGDGLAIVGAGPDGKFRVSRNGQPFEQPSWYLPAGVTARAMAGSAQSSEAEFGADWHEGYLGRQVSLDGVAWRERFLILGSDGLVYSPWEDGREHRGEMPSLLWHFPTVPSDSSIAAIARAGVGYSEDTSFQKERERLLHDCSLFEKLVAVRFWSLRDAAVDAFRADPNLEQRLALADLDTRLLLLDLVPPSVRREYLESAHWDEASDSGRELSQMRDFLLQSTAQSRLLAQAPLERLALAMGRSYVEVQADFDRLLVIEPELANQPMFMALNTLLAQTDPLWSLGHAQPRP